MKSFLATVTPIQKKVWQRLALLYICTVACAYILSSGSIGSWLGFSTIQSEGGNHFPFILLAALLAGFAFFYRSKFQKEDCVLSQGQLRKSLIGFGIVFLVSFFLTHPPLYFIHLLTAYIRQNPEINGTMVSATVYILTLLPFFPLTFCFFSLHFFSKFRTPFVGIGIVMIALLYANVIEAKYHQATSLFTLYLTERFLSLFPGSTVVNYANIRLSYNYFEVTVGPVCSGLTMLTLFVCMFGFIFYQLHKRKAIFYTRAFFAFAAGICFTFLLNVLRIGLIMLIGSKNPDFGIGLFHSSIGAILFFCLFVLYLHIVVPFLKRKTNT